MTGFTSVGDLSRSVLLRQANAHLKSRLLTLTQEAATGLRSDVPAALNGQMGPLAQLQDRLLSLQAHEQAAALARSEMDGLQGAMEAMQKLGAGLLPAGNMADATNLGIRVMEARQDFHSAARLLNVSVAGRHVLSGTAVDTPPLSGPADMLAGARAQVAGLTDPAQIAAALDTWFAAPPGAGGFADAHFHGNTKAREVPVAPGETIRLEHNALDPAFRDLLKGLALGALATDLGLSGAQSAGLLDEAGRRVAAATTALTLQRADLGFQEAALERAAARSAAETTALSLARSDMLSADPYETATALNQAETGLQNLYALTSRLSRLSLTDYL
ncbi:flagellar hook protein [Paracoccus sp. MC1854]|uniref:flagellin n=1 Tax=Paracoccus sp. MC1854 TaxID=2760306 RepID=UPI0016041E30|nr:flagellin [Paracoccus sp. MC1854]MBB1490252.1 flagellar hook protein [Paracoccus sp. MC1854]